MYTETAVVAGGASGLGLATVKRLARRGVSVLIVDLDSSEGREVAKEMGNGVAFVPADVTDVHAMETALDAAESVAPIRSLVHCAGKGATLRVVEHDGNPGSLDTFKEIIEANLIGTFNSLRLTAARMMKNAPVDGDRGVCVLTSSVAAWEGQVGQIAYASAKAGIVGMTLVAARDLSRNLVRVCTIAPGIFDTPMLDRLSKDTKDNLAKSVPHPARLGDPDEFAALAEHILDNHMLNGEVIRLDGAVRMQPR